MCACVEAVCINPPRAAGLQQNMFTFRAWTICNIMHVGIMAVRTYCGSVSKRNSALVRNGPCDVFVGVVMPWWADSEHGIDIIHEDPCTRLYTRSILSNKTYLRDPPREVSDQYTSVVNLFCPCLLEIQLVVGTEICL